VSTIVNDEGCVVDVVSLSAVVSRTAVPARSASAAPATRRWAAPCSALPAAAAAFDIAILTFAAPAGEFVYRRFALGEAAGSGDLAGGLLAGALFVLLAQLAGLYRLPTLLAPGASLPRLTLTVALAQLAVVSVLFLLKSGADHSRGATIAFAALALALTPLGRLALARAARLAIRRGAIQGCRVVTLGDPFELERLDDADFPHFGMEEVARVRLSGSAALGGELLESDRARIGQAIACARELRATEFAAVMPWGAEAALADLCALLRASPLPVRLYPDEKIRRVLRRGRDGGLARRFSVTLQRAPLGAAERAAKRAFDVVLAATALITLAPALLTIAALIRLQSPGPAIFRQRRCGFDNREFVMFKFRTMRVLEDRGPIVQASPNDWRVTRFGRLLRRSSLDELPQLLNVLRGEMSLVGPRPHAVAHDDEYKARIANYALRHHVKPGLTGAAQVAGFRGATPHLSQMERRVERDLWYVDNWSMALDLKILVATVFVLLRLDAY
jgi:undecaprenyl-phosphate galactose phosphotransferase/putative colanic acid biosynthesis UDP-glucose lipid carrier transferase